VKRGRFLVPTTEQHLISSSRRASIVCADFAEVKYKSVVWTLVDSDDGFTNDFTQHSTVYAVPVFVIYATSPVSPAAE
jgi:hypothetical protein